MNNSNFVTTTEFSHSVTPPVVAFVGEHQGRKIVMGSGTIIAPHLALTCLHIFDEGFAKEFLGERLIDLEGYFRIPKNIPFGLYAILGDNNDPLAHWFNVDLVSLSPFSDLALARLQPIFSDVSFKWPCTHLSAVPPAVDVATTAYGYVYEHRQTSKGEQIFIPRLYRSKGVVMEVWDEKRDNSMVNFPAFQTDARYDHAMSGGPVCLPCGLIAGVISTGWKFQEGGYYSVAASLYPLLGSRIECRLVKEGPYGDYTVRELVDRNLIRMAYAEPYQLIIADDGLVEQVTYDRR